MADIIKATAHLGKPIVLSERGYILMANDGAFNIFGIGESRIIGHYIFEFVAEKSADDVLRRIPAQDSGAFSFILHRPDNIEYNLEIRTYPVMQTDSNLMVTIVNNWNLI